MKTMIIKKELNGIEYNELVGYMKDAISQSIFAYCDKDKSWFKDCEMLDYWNDIQEIWDGDEKIGEGLDTIAHKFVLNDDTRADFESAFEEARDAAYEDYVNELCDEISEKVESTDFDEVIELDDEVTDDERKNFPHCTDNELVASRIDEICDNLEAKGFKRFCIDSDNILEFDNQFAQDLYDTNKITAEEISKWFGTTVKVAYQGHEPFDYEYIYYKAIATA